MANIWKKGFRALASKMGDYSAQPAFEQSAVAAGNLVKTPMKESIEASRGRQVGTGRLRTGFGFQEEDRMVRDIWQNFYDQLASRALSAQQLELQARGLEGDIYAGGWDRRIAEKNANSRKKGGLFGALGSVGGALVGSAVPGLGTALGAYLGGQLGGAAGQYL